MEKGYLKGAGDSPIERRCDPHTTEIMGPPVCHASEDVAFNYTY
jgi:hypothetical protein